MANVSKQPPPEGKVADDKAGKVGHTDHGIPPDALEEEPTGLPTSDRHHGEIAPAKH